MYALYGERSWYGLVLYIIYIMCQCGRFSRNAAGYGEKWGFCAVGAQRNDYLLAKNML